MSDTLTISAPAKLNLWLRVLGKRKDGFHDLQTRMAPLRLCDELTLTRKREPGLEFTCSDPSLPVDESNLVVKAVRAMERYQRKKFGLRIHLEKKIPSGAGLGGGSSDAAATLKAINTMMKFNLKTDKLVRLAATIGSDVPFFIHGTVCDVSGRGEIVTPVDKKLPRLPVVLLKPAFGISSAWAYQNLAKAKQSPLPPIIPQICPWGRMENDLEWPVFMKFPLLAEMKEWLLHQPGVHAALLSGSGSTVFAVLRESDEGEAVAGHARQYFGEETWTYCGSTC